MEIAGRKFSDNLENKKSVGLQGIWAGEMWLPEQEEAKSAENGGVCPGSVIFTSGI